MDWNLWEFGPKRFDPVGIKPTADGEDAEQGDALEKLPARELSFD
jgi:hypothetical protein